jgi:hypothetical protein
MMAPLLGAPFAAVTGVASSGLGDCLLDEHDADGTAGTLVMPAKRDEEGKDGGLSCLGRLHATWEGLVEPLVVLVIGVGFSVAALWVAITAFLVDVSHV